MIEYRNKAGRKFLDKTIFTDGKKDLELSFSAACDKSCYYCYLKDFGDKLYPCAPTEQILNNLRDLLDYLTQKRYCFNQLDIFTGEFFALPYWRDVLDIILESKFRRYYGIVIPTNFSFVEKGLADEIYEYKKKFEEEGIKFHLSCSIDGENDYETRPSKGGKIANISKVLDEVERFGAGLHPMVSPKFLNEYKKNADFWINTTLRFDDTPMFLEVRNNFWDKTSIDNFCKFMMYFADQLYEKVFKGDVGAFSKSFFDFDSEYRRYNCYLLTFPHILQRIACSFHSTIFIRVSDLKLIPCHRMSYPQFIYGHFSKDENGDLEFYSDNLDFHITASTFNPSSFLPKCADCEIRSFCIKGCLGSQFETNNDPFIPINSVCQLEKAKYVMLHKIAKKYGFYDICLSDPLLSSANEASVRYIATILDKLENETEVNYDYSND